MNTSTKRTSTPVVAKPVHQGRDAAMTRARAMLAKLKPYDRWIATMTDQHKSRVESLGFEPKEFYDRLVGKMTQESIDPTPTRIFVPKPGSQAKARFYYG